MWTKGIIELDDVSTWSVPTEDLLAHLHQLGELISHVPGSAYQEHENIISGANFEAATPSPLTPPDSFTSEPLPVSDLTSWICLPSPLKGRFLISESGYLLSDVAKKGKSRPAKEHCSSVLPISLGETCEF